MLSRLSVLANVLAVALLAGESLCQRKATPVYVGCFVDKLPPDRDMLGLVGVAQLGIYSVLHPSQGIVSRHDMTVDLCSEICIYGGFQYAAVQNSNECMCDSSYGSWGSAPEAECSNPCSGNHGQVCGSSLRASIYKSTFSGSKVHRFRKFAASAAQSWSPLPNSPAPSAGTSRRRAGSIAPPPAPGLPASSCSSYRFNSSSGLCRLSNFATAFDKETGDVWIIG
uniref:WSC domain-containing protein n=1 Tax=Macrostomum lignano TaxID=282301 RepID=A0A1I8IAD4_9PLAT